MKMPLATAAVVFASSLAYLGLAALGAGGLAAFWARPQFAALALVTLALAAAACFSEGGLRRGVREDRENRWVIAAFAVLGLADAYLPAWADRRGVWTFGGEALRWAGVVLCAAGGALRLWPVFVLGKRFSGLVAIQPGHQLVTTGIYGRIRNPSYLGLLLFMTGWALAFRAGAGLAVAALVLVPLFFRIRAEEALLRSHFGAEYDAYCARTWRLVPYVY
ncbi:MAG TPA: isoprenylcysteine carboxylmethyltransferase family protein [Elusimicrobiota bacterium]|nr:isoprenylcysteine carboxylmethyltransferase family protein [Elusimicrobiota bacterium]